MEELVEASHPLKSTFLLDVDHIQTARKLS